MMDFTPPPPAFGNLGILKLDKCLILGCSHHQSPHGHCHLPKFPYFPYIPYMYILGGTPCEKKINQIIAVLDILLELMGIG